MGFDPAKHEPNIIIVVEHEDYPGVEFSFTFPKELSAAADEEDAKYIGLTNDERAEVKHAQLILTVGAMLVEAPQGFDRFPQDERPLVERLTAYDEMIVAPAQKKLFESLLDNAWLKYKTSRIPQVYLRRAKDHSTERSGDGRKTGGD